MSARQQHLNFNGEQRPFGGFVVSEPLQEAPLCPTMDETQLMQHLNNIADFARYNDLDIFDDVNGGKTSANQVQEPRDEHFIRGLLMNLELLAHRWKLIDPKKYAHRFNNQN